MAVRLPHTGHGIQFSPYDAHLVGVVSSQHYGIVGAGAIQVLFYDPETGSLSPAGAVGETRDGVYDLAWSEAVETHLVTAGADGMVRMYDTAAPPGLVGGAGAAPPPIAGWEFHTAEVASVAWGGVDKTRFASSSWDASIAVWDPTGTQPVSVLSGFKYCVYQVTWSPDSPHILAGASGDATARLFDLAVGNDPVLTIPAHDYEILTCDFNKYAPHILATGSTDKSIALWDTRKPDAPFSILDGHSLAVRNVRFSPWSSSTLASVGYDMAAMVWDIGLESGAPPTILQRAEHHSEFVVGLDWSLFLQDVLATAAWDCSAYVFPLGIDPSTIPLPPSPLPQT